MNRISSIVILGVLAVILSGGYIGYISWDSSSKGAELKKVESSISDYESQKLIEKNAEILQAVTAKNTVATLTDDIIKWSRVIRDINETIPQGRSDTLLEVMSYSGGRDRSISMNVKTKPIHSFASDDSSESESDDSSSSSSDDDSALTSRTAVNSESDGSYNDVADFIESFDDSELFVDVFVPSISSGSNSDGDEILTFNISTSYLANYDE